MVTSASFKLNEMGGGRVLFASTGTMVAGNEISGDLYAVSDRAMLEQGQKDVYVNRNALTASEIDVNLMSASPMWEVSLVDSAEDSADDAAAQAEDEPAVEQPTVKDEDEADNDSSTSDKPSSEKTSFITVSLSRIWLIMPARRLIWKAIMLSATQFMTV